MDEMKLWTAPVRMPQIEPPRLLCSSGRVYQKIGDGVELARCTDAPQKLYLPDRVCGHWLRGVGAGALSGCTQVRQVVLPRGVRRIGDYAFYCCEGLESVRLPEGLCEIGDRAFAWCTGLESLWLPATVERIGEDAFEGTEGLILSAEENSFVHRFAREHGLNFRAVSGPNAA